MTSNDSDQPSAHLLPGRARRRRERIKAELARNRAGDHRVPTWVLAALLGLIVLAVVVLIIS